MDKEFQALLCIIGLMISTAVCGCLWAEALKDWRNLNKEKYFLLDTLCPTSQDEICVQYNSYKTLKTQGVVSQEFIINPTK